MVQEGCPFIAALCADEPLDVVERPQHEPLARRRRDAGRAARGEPGGDERRLPVGMVFRGKLDIPVIDWRHYLEQQLNMHNSHQSFASRQRLLNYDGDASNQLIWFTDARPAGPASDPTPQALLVLDRWIKNIEANPGRSVGENKPADAKDSCFATNGTLIASGDDVWNGILDDKPAGACTQAFPTFGRRGSSPAARSRAASSNAPCSRSRVRSRTGSTARGRRRRRRSTRLTAIFPSGVCDYSKPDQMLPPELSGSRRGRRSRKRRARGPRRVRGPLAARQLLFGPISRNASPSDRGRWPSRPYGVSSPGRSIVPPSSSAFASVASTSSTAK